MLEVKENMVSGVYYRSVGAGKCMVLLHGFPENGTLWDNVVPALSAHYQLIIPDLPGSGQSPLLHSTSITDMAALLNQILDTERIGRAVIVGHSMGGYVALAFLRSFPEKVVGISLVHSTPVADDDEKKTNRRKTIEIVAKGGKNAFLRQMVGGLFSDSFKLQSPETVESQILKAYELGSEGFINFYTAMMERQESVSLLENLTIPLQWIMGKDDHIIPVEKILSLFYGPEVNFLQLNQDCGHMGMIEQPERLTKDLLHFTDYCYSLKMHV